MSGPLGVLLAVIVLSGTKPVKNATINCVEVMTHDEEGNYAYGEDWAPTDSAGVMYMEGDYKILYHCWARATGYLSWSGTLTYTKEKKWDVIRMNKETK